MCSFTFNRILVLIGCMNTQTNATRRLEQEISNTGVPPRGKKVPPLEEEANAKQASVDPPPLTNENIRTSLLQMDQTITIQAQVSTTQSKGMTAQENREVVPRPHQQVTTNVSRLRAFTRMNHPAFYGSKVDEDPQEFIDEVSKILMSMGLSSSEKAELPKYQLMDVAQAWYVQWRDEGEKSCRVQQYFPRCKECL